MPPKTKRPTLTLQPRCCEICKSKQDLKQCARCHVTWYCGREHQAADWKIKHRHACPEIAKSRRQYETAEAQLRGGGDLADVFYNGVGYFWGIPETRPYMSARFAHADLVLQLYAPAGGHKEVVEYAIRHYLDMLRLSRKDNMGIRNAVPALYIRLGRDKEAYDFLKWWADFGLTDLPPGDVKNEDILEAPHKEWTDGSFLDVSQVLSATLIKVRTLLDLQSLQNATRAFQGSVPQEIIDEVRGHLLSNGLASRPEILKKSEEELSKLIELNRQYLRTLHRSIQKHNKHLWDLLLTKDEDYFDDRPDSMMLGSVEEAMLSIAQNYMAWAETPGAIDLMDEVHSL